MVAVGTYQRTRRPPSVFCGTGFVVADGLHVITNAHVLPEKVDSERKEIIAIFAGKGNVIDIREATKVAEDRAHDVVILKITGQPLVAMPLGDSDKVREGETYAFTGFPIGMMLGLNAVTHRGIISAVTPIVIPQLSGQLLTKDFDQARPYDIFQLDATVYQATVAARRTIPKRDSIGTINKVSFRRAKRPDSETEEPHTPPIKIATLIKNVRQEYPRADSIIDCDRSSLNHGVIDVLSATRGLLPPR